MWNRAFHKTLTGPAQHIKFKVEKYPYPGGIRTRSSANEQPHTHALDRMATEFGTYNDMTFIINLLFCESFLTEICR